MIFFIAGRLGFLMMVKRKRLIRHYFLMESFNTSTTCFASRFVPSKIWWRQLVSLARITSSGFPLLMRKDNVPPRWGYHFLCFFSSAISPLRGCKH
jgi:hypothetical protein